MSDARADSPGPAPDLTEVAAVVGAPAFILPWLDRFYDPGDAELLLAAAGAGGAAALEAFGAARLERAVRRAVLDRADSGAFAPASFHDRLEVWAMFEGWKDVPLAVHRRLADWEVEHYTGSVREDVDAVRAAPPGEPPDGAYAYVLLHEAEAVVMEQEHVYLWPCDCRAIVSKCRKPMNVCLRFENDRGLGWEISKERAVEILRRADKAGLMHTDYVSSRASDPHAICNCCTDCCFPHLATERLGAGDVWPVRRYVAAIDLDICTKCGRCGLRCPFEAIVCRQDGRPDLTPGQCRGCGLCQTGCSVGAIELRPLARPGASGPS